jgi:hypothetical protein
MGGGARRDPLGSGSLASVDGERSESPWKLPETDAVGIFD